VLRNTGSVEQLVRESILVPDAISIKNEHFFGLHVTEDHILVEHIDAPEELAGNNICINLLEVLDVNYNSADTSVEISFMEYNLLSVRQELSVECEKVDMGHDSGHAETGNNEWHQQELRDSGQPAEATENDKVIHDS
jgi:hypothetical protein